MVKPLPVRTAKDVEGELRDLTKLNLEEIKDVEEIFRVLDMEEDERRSHFDDPETADLTIFDDAVEYAQQLGLKEFDMEFLQNTIRDFEAIKRARGN